MKYFDEANNTPSLFFVIRFLSLIFRFSHNSVLIFATFPYYYQVCSPQNSFNIYSCLFAHSLLHFQITVCSYVSEVTAHSWPSNAHSKQTRTVSCKYRRCAQSALYKHDVMAAPSCSWLWSYCLKFDTHNWKSAATSLQYWVAHN